ncbi:uncharacterized protein PHACADRAFT_253376 [Phanerochaete carnosa HHB-10118-sp]|uniref:Uncharacterized protein n=1 Tax=Phanerochaete carnosa (strain HHB-10118-sp) TaxID=650164 RepID=K5WBI4_PHACS|nr:uncharacterized protein PHACADRAFT_253376 [Phanerochaete carnosa HHB-10118-sp]EKM56314.1 hypothetical protein PHACADRAFT_253376 [Phanerochaete carnosa HHB-10118-sp]
MSIVALAIDVRSGRFGAVFTSTCIVSGARLRRIMPYWRCPQAFSTVVASAFLVLSLHLLAAQLQRH